MEQPGRDDNEFEHRPWLFAGEAGERQRAAQRKRQQKLTASGAIRIDDGCFIAASAAVYPDRLHLGPRSYIAAHAYVTDDVQTGSDCSLNPFTTVRGTVQLGDGVRIGAHTSLLGFNHTAEIDRPVHRPARASARSTETGAAGWTMR